MVKEPREIQAAEFCTPPQIHERAADFTARRVLAALHAAETDTHGLHRVRPLTPSGRQLGADRAQVLHSATS